jgi:hypothetical protein
MIRTSSRPRRLRALLVAAALSVSMFASALPAAASPNAAAQDRAPVVSTEGGVSPNSWIWTRNGGEGFAPESWIWTRSVDQFGAESWIWTRSVDGDFSAQSWIWTS